MFKNKLIIAGIGPGNINLLSICLISALEKCNVILYDSLINKSCLNIKNKRSLILNIGKLFNEPFNNLYNILIKILVLKYYNIKVLWLKNGNPLLYSRWNTELIFIKSYDINYNIIPGSTSSLTGLSYLNIPITCKLFINKKFINTIIFLTGLYYKNLNLILNEFF